MRLEGGVLALTALAVAQGAGSIAFGSLPPLLPHYVLILHLSVRGAGLLSAGFGVGALLGVLPACVLSGRNPRSTAMSGLLILAASTAVIGLAKATPQIDLARLGQGFGDSLAGTGALTAIFQVAPTFRQSETLGRVNTLAITGAFLGPALAVAAGEWGTPWAFSVAAIGIALLATSAFWIPTRSGSGESATVLVRSVAQALAHRHSLPLALQAALGGLLATLAPLRLSRVGWSSTSVAAAFLVGSVLGALCYTKVGRRCDQRGGRAVTIELLVASAFGAAALAYGNRWLLAPILGIDTAIVSVLAIPTISRLFATSEQSGRPHGSSSALVFAIWAIFNVAGALGAASIAAVLGTSLPFLLAAGFCALIAILERLPRIRSACPRVSSIDRGIG